MNGEWKTYKIGELTSWASGGTPSKSKEEYWDGEIAWISAKTFKSNRISDSEVKITQLGLDNGSRIAPKDSILLLVRGSGLFNDIPIGIVEKPVAFNQDIKALKVNQEIIDVYFFLYWLIGNKDLLRTKLEETGIGAGKFDTEIIKSLEISLPPLNKQKIIAEIAKDLDDKIALNREMNASLEAMAQTLFKEWFIKPTTEGVLPDGWREIELNEIISIKHGYAFKGNQFSEESTDDILVTPGNFKIGGGFNFSKFKYYSGEYPQSYIFDRYDLAVTMTDLSKDGDTLGYSAIIPKFGNKRLLHNQRIGKVEFRQSKKVNFFLYWLMRQTDYRNFVLSGSTGTTVKHTSPTNILKYKFILPDDKILAKFEKIAFGLFEKEEANINEIETLTRLRDSLLPKLLRGEIVV
jgi:type I restriction enzyme, S subunit